MGRLKIKKKKAKPIKTRIPVAKYGKKGEGAVIASTLLSGKFITPGYHPKGENPFE